MSKSESESRNRITDTSKITPSSMLLAVIPGLQGVAEEQERAGQRKLARSDQLPRSGLLGADRAAWESVGVRILDDKIGDDPLFCEVELPAGWGRRPTDHPLHTDLVDERGRTRGRIFYKAASYDRRADIYMLRRLSIKRDFSRVDYQSVIQYQVTDGGRVVFRSAERTAYDTRQDGERGRRAYAMNDAIDAALFLQCRNWLISRGILSHDPTANWDVEIAPADRSEAMPTIGVPPGRISGHRAIAHAREGKIPVLIGRAARDEDPIEVEVQDAQRIVDDGTLDADVFWVDEPSQPEWREPQVGGSESLAR